ncbi:MAG: hypothetical protein AAF074_26380 [Pseudomonadota bacterium]
MSGGGSWRAAATVASSAACVDGHFPGNPIVPGAVLLAHASEALSARGFRITAMQRVKFLSALAPDTPFEMVVDTTRSPARLRWLAGERVLGEAVLTLEPADG